MRLTNERTRRGWSRAELARRAGMNATTVSLIESGRFYPYLSQLKKLARALGVPDSEAYTLVGGRHQQIFGPAGTSPSGDER